VQARRSKQERKNMFFCPTCLGYVQNHNGSSSSSSHKKEEAQSLPTSSSAEEEESTIQKQEASQQSHPKQQDEEKICSICLGFFWSTCSDSFGFAQRLEQAVQQAVQPYHGFSSTASTASTSRCLFSRLVSPPRMNLPGDFIARLVKARNKNASNGPASNIVTDFAQDLKLHAKTLLDDCLNRLENSSDKSIKNDTDDENYPPCVQEEEQGHLAIYVIVLPAHHVARPFCVARMAKNGSKQSRRRRQQQQQHCHGNQDGLSQQGGDPYLNLENKVQGAQGGTTAVIWTMNQALNSSNSIDDNGDDGFFTKPIRVGLENKSNGENGNGSDHATTPALDIYVAVWRRPFYLQSMYTKTHRDVSQTPFYVVDSVIVDDNGNDSSKTCPNDDSYINDGGKEESTTVSSAKLSNNKRRKTQRVRRKLGVTSVEEEILPTITKYAGGISTLNNVHDGGATCSVDSNNMQIQFGMAKFHASGREDMDVRMLLPSDEHTNNTNDNITGRPFVCEMIDAYRLPPMSSLAAMVNDINHTSSSATTTASAIPDMAKDDDDDKSAMIRAYGNNPRGVGIAPCLKFVPSSSFKNLQAMTESKVKYYCCLCWSEKPLSSLLSNDKDNTNDKQASTTMDEILGSFPKEIQQRTPLRVLHRRPNIIRLRHVLSCRATPIDEHHFRLHLSTDAGTCKYSTATAV
jgi:tRNA U54 and U55 pseudouridine synthase Pus10